jgi:prepilin-type N-terminal cleavage/methylation domain-containing protein
MLKNTNKGFTLIELIMVMIILGIMAAVAIPRYLETIQKSEIASEDAVVTKIWSH